MTIIDITPAVSAATPVFPGDTIFTAERSWNIGPDCPVNVSRLTMSTHAGAHADAPLHYHPRGVSIDAVDLAPYLGPCAVVRLINDEAAISSEALEAALVEHIGEIPARVLIRTYERQPKAWDPVFTAISAQAINWLAMHGVKLVGVDTPSLDPATSKTMDAHKAVYTHDMRVLECLCLDKVEPGLYELIAPPLKLMGLDAAPVRALLRTSS